jgi:23S rRNA (cytidine1920-2'-O)/16S rRNA (cytidine1409-2'-O)-methyltransferase
LTASREQARVAIAEGRVTVGGAPADKPARLVGPDEPLVVATPAAWVSRGGQKLDAALEHWAIDVAGNVALDAGASTGGFTDVLLARGARAVHAVDVGRAQLHDRLRRDPRVIVHDRTNIRTADVASLGGEPFEVVVADLSFISLRTVMPNLCGALAAEGATVVLLVKPQFEAGRQVVSAGRGVVRDPAAWAAALVGVGRAAGAAGAAIMGAMPSPITGADGNAEFLLWARAHTAGGIAADALAEVALAEVAP